MPRLLYLFSAINLIIGSSAFVLASIVEPLARDLGVSVAAAGQATTAYAVGTALLAPLLLLATGRWPRKRVLLLALALFTLGNGLSALSNHLALLLVARVLMGAGAVFVAVAAGIAVALVVPARRGQALSLVFLGMSLSYVIGVPVGAWLGLSFGWATPVWLACGMSALALLAVALGVPRDIQAPGASFAGLGTLLKRPEVAASLGVTLLYFGAIFSVFSYIGAVLRALSVRSDTQLSLTLMMFGVSGVCGTLLGGWATDRFGAQRTLGTQLGLFLLTMSLVPLTQGRYRADAGRVHVLGRVRLRHDGTAASAAGGHRPATLAGAAVAERSMMYFGMALGAALGGALLPMVGFDAPGLGGRTAGAGGAGLAALVRPSRRGAAVIGSVTTR